MSIETLVEKMKLKIDTFCYKSDELSNKVLYLEYNLVSINQGNELCSVAHISLKDTFKTCLSLKSSLKFNKFIS